MGTRQKCRQNSRRKTSLAGGLRLSVLGVWMIVLDITIADENLRIDFLPDWVGVCMIILGLLAWERLPIDGRYRREISFVLFMAFATLARGLCSPFGDPSFVLAGWIGLKLVQILELLAIVALPHAISRASAHLRLQTGRTHWRRTTRICALAACFELGFEFLLIFSPSIDPLDDLAKFLNLVTTLLWLCALIRFTFTALDTARAIHLIPYTERLFDRKLRSEPT